MHREPMDTMDITETHHDAHLSHLDKEIPGYPRVLPSQIIHLGTECNPTDPTEGMIVETNSDKAALQADQGQIWTHMSRTTAAMIAAMIAMIARETQIRILIGAGQGLIAVTIAGNLHQEEEAAVPALETEVEVNVQMSWNF